MKQAFAVLILLALNTHFSTTFAQVSRLFRISGPAATTLIAFNADGTMVWSNALPGATYTVQTVTALPGGTNWADYVQLPVTNALNTNLLVAFHPPAGMALVPAGLFRIGNYILDGTTVTNDPDNTGAIPTNVIVSGFYMDVNLVSYGQWQSVYSYAINHGYTFANAGTGKAANHPVYSINWYDCAKWCNARSQQEGLVPVYYMDAGFTQVYTNGQNQFVFANWAVNGYRLPTEAEWEKAARGGLSGRRFPFGNTISWSQANYSGKPLSLDPSGYDYDFATAIGYDPAFNDGVQPYTSPVGSFAANAYGLNDMTGNLTEWCWDWLRLPPYTSGSAYLGGIDPHGATIIGFKLLRGGDWGNPAIIARCAMRSYSSPVTASIHIGFRCARGL